MLVVWFADIRAEPASIRQVAAKAQIGAFVEALRSYKKDAGDFPSTRSIRH
jgi:hypothetical protein